MRTQFGYEHITGRRHVVTVVYLVARAIYAEYVCVDQQQQQHGDYQFGLSTTDSSSSTHHGWFKLVSYTINNTPSPPEKVISSQPQSVYVTVCM